MEDGARPKLVFRGDREEGGSLRTVISQPSWQRAPPSMTTCHAKAQPSDFVRSVCSTRRRTTSDTSPSASSPRSKSAISCCRAAPRANRTNACLPARGSAASCPAISPTSCPFIRLRGLDCGAAALWEQRSCGFLFRRLAARHHHIHRPTVLLEDSLYEGVRRGCQGKAQEEAAAGRRAGCVTPPSNLRKASSSNSLKNCKSMLRGVCTSKVQQGPRCVAAPREQLPLGTHVVLALQLSLRDPCSHRLSSTTGSSRRSGGPRHGGTARRSSRDTPPRPDAERRQRFRHRIVAEAVQRPPSTRRIQVGLSRAEHGSRHKTTCTDSFGTSFPSRITYASASL